jgi:hypothetical protein
MTKLLLVVHVLAAIIFIGPVTVAASMFPPVARRALTTDAGVERDGAVLRVLHRISRVYAIAGLSVPILGLATGLAMGVLGDAWLMISVVLTIVAGVVLAVRVVPDQAKVLAAVDGPRESRPALLPRAKTLSMVTGMFALLWAVVVVLMIVRPGSTTGV